MLTREYVKIALQAAVEVTKNPEFIAWARLPNAMFTRCPTIVTKGTIEYDSVAAVYALQRAWASYNTERAQTDNALARKLAHKCVMSGYEPI